VTRNIQNAMTSPAGFLLLPGLVGFTIAFRTCLAVLLFQEDPQRATILSGVLSLALLLAAVSYSAGGLPSIAFSCFRTQTIRWIAAFLALALVSLLWSAAPSATAGGYWVAWAADVLTIWFLLRGGVAEGQASALMKGFVWGACVVAVIAWAIPATEDLRLGDEVYMHPNVIGFLFGIGTFLAIHLTSEKTMWRWPALFLGMTLLRTISKSSIVAFVAAFSFYLIYDSTFSRKVKVRIGLAVGVILGSLWGVLETYLNTYAESTSLETLTGRTLIWGVSLEYALEKPFLGNGFFAYRFVVPPFGEFQAQQAHDELLQQFFSFGAAGVILTIALYWMFFSQVRRAPDSRLKNLSGALLLFALVHGLTDSQIADLSLPLWLMTMLSILLASATQQTEKTTANLEYQE
jgi:exopolysaccharide production protein ExoQ